ncbi:MAG TPA: hypothetical protein VF802_06420 [Candidatus Limnocylindrales bacterium]
MAKRTRGTSRPGQRRPAQRPAARPVATPVRPTNTLTAAEEARAAEIEAQLVAEERAAEQARARGRDRSRVAPEPVARTRPGQGSLLAARASEEYTYVVRDVRRIARIGGSMIGIMAILYIALEIAKL